MPLHKLICNPLSSFQNSGNGNEPKGYSIIYVQSFLIDMIFQKTIIFNKNTWKTCFKKLF